MAEQPGERREQAGPGGHGSVEEEAHRLVRAAADWWHAREEQAQPGARAATADTEPAGHETASGAACTGCPWCRAKAALGPATADTLLGVADLLGSAADSLRAYAQSQGARDPQQRAEEEPEAGNGEQPESGSGDHPGAQP